MKALASTYVICPNELPLPATTADTTVSTSEFFTFWLQGGRIDVGFLGAAQVDRFANINTTVIGTYGKPAVRLPGAGGAPEIAGSAGEVLIILRQTRKTFVGQLDFTTSVGHGTGGDYRRQIGLTGAGPVAVITDLCILRSDPVSKELTLTDIHSGVTLDEVLAATTWHLKVSSNLKVIDASTSKELLVLRELEQQTARAHEPREKTTP